MGEREGQPGPEERIDQGIAKMEEAKDLRLGKIHEERAQDVREAAAQQREREAAKLLTPWPRNQRGEKLSSAEVMVEASKLLQAGRKEEAEGLLQLVKERHEQVYGTSESDKTPATSAETNKREDDGPEYNDYPNEIELKREQ